MTWHRGHMPIILWWRSEHPGTRKERPTVEQRKAHRARDRIDELARRKREREQEDS